MGGGGGRCGGTAPSVLRCSRCLAKALQEHPSIFTGAAPLHQLNTSHLPTTAPQPSPTTPMTRTLTTIWYSSGWGMRYPAKTTFLSRCSCLQGVKAGAGCVSRPERWCVRYMPQQCPAGTHMRTRLPTVWSSRCTTKVPALASLVSGLKATLRCRPGRLEVLSSSKWWRRWWRRAAPHAPSPSRRPPSLTSSHPRVRRTSPAGLARSSRRGPTFGLAQPLQVLQVHEELLDALI